MKSSFLENNQKPEVVSNQGKASTSTSVFFDALIDHLVEKEGLTTSFSSSFSFYTQTRPKYHFATELGIEERKQLEEIARAMAVFADERHLPRYGLLNDIGDAFNWPANYATQVVAFCRRMSAYDCLPPADQLAVLKAFYMELLTLRTAFNYDPPSNGYPVLAVIFCY